MLSKVIKTGKLKVKYVLGNHTLTKNYPTREDVLFEMFELGKTKIVKEPSTNNDTTALRLLITHSSGQLSNEQMKMAKWFIKNGALVYPPLIDEKHIHLYKSIFRQ